MIRGKTVHYAPSKEREKNDLTGFPARELAVSPARSRQKSAFHQSSDGQFPRRESRPTAIVNVLVRRRPLDLFGGVEPTPGGHIRRLSVGRRRRRSVGVLVLGRFVLRTPVLVPLVLTAPGSRGLSRGRAGTAGSGVDLTGAVVAGGKFGTIIGESTLSDPHEDRLMIAGRGHGTTTVVARRQPLGNGDGDGALTISLPVDAFEKGEVGAIQRILRSQRPPKILAGDVGMSHDLAVVQSLRGCVVGVGRVGKGAGLEALDLDLDIKGLVGCDDVARLRVEDDGRDDGLSLEGGDITHHWTTHQHPVGTSAPAREILHTDTVARTALDLLSVRQDALEGAFIHTKVDEVGIVPRGRLARPGGYRRHEIHLRGGACLACLYRTGLPVLSAAGLHRLRIEGESASSSTTAGSVGIVISSGGACVGGRCRGHGSRGRVGRRGS